MHWAYAMCLINASALVSCRLTAVFTPAVSKLSGQQVNPREWAACSVALLGGILISLDGLRSAESISPDLAFGELRYPAAYNLQRLD